MDFFLKQKYARIAREICKNTETKTKI